MQRRVGSGAALRHWTGFVEMGLAAGKMKKRTSKRNDTEQAAGMIHAGAPAGRHRRSLE